MFIERAASVLSLVADPVCEMWLKELNPKGESLQTFYKEGKYRKEIYDEIVEKILSRLRETNNVCVVFYGHPGVLVYPAREAMRHAHLEGYEVRMLPGLSAEANLLADLGIDPGLTGIQSYEATSFLINRNVFDTSAGLILWQIGSLGETRWEPTHKVQQQRLKVLAEYLGEHYGPEHVVILYEAAEYPLAVASVRKLCLSELPQAEVSGASTLYVPPKEIPTVDPEMVSKLQIDWQPSA